MREDYSANGDAWRYFPHDQARSRVYRWGEDGLLGICDNHCRLCFSLALWNERDSILKERLFGLTGPEGNHGEDVKEYYYYLDSTPTHSYLKALYKYPQSAYPYQRLIDENRSRGKKDLEYELEDTGAFHENRYFDVFAEYAKAEPEDLLIQVTIANRGREPAPLHVLPQVWFRNTWVWGDSYEADWGVPSIELLSERELLCRHSSLGEYILAVEPSAALLSPAFLFTENETNTEKLFGIKNASPYVKDGINDYIVGGEKGAVNPAGSGTKMSAHYKAEIPGGGSKTIRLRLSNSGGQASPFGAEFEKIFRRRMMEADEFYRRINPFNTSGDLKSVQRQAFAGMLWTKQFYYYVIEDWLRGDPNNPS
ncbi:MAG: glucosidase, partial [Candidatus Dadabacteria bacterium]